ncbi:uncharacterized protein LOC132041488 [Lycium ferocissimum]|uniref:uncharacterized protein LOC132041488 n=1 Tax=Lycium ferocissimum TaxID=112874 RepID=UPI002816233F|nr:uncharacterized protein LOC132041488 [Lycium ferocissimum]
MFLSSCVLLECLSIRESTQLQHLDVIGPSLKLKHLEIHSCDILSSLKINQCINLVSFSYEGSETNFDLEIVTSVLDVHIDAYFFPSLSRLATTLATKFTQLVMLSLEVNFGQLMGMDSYSLPKFNNLKQVMLSVSNVTDCSHIGIPPLLDTSPNLQKFEIEFIWCYMMIVIGQMLFQKAECPYQHLKVIRYNGYLRGSSDAELMTYLLENCLALEKLIVSPCNFSPHSRKCSKVERRSRSRAWRQLEGKVSERVELIIL